ncbi:LisH domain-containing protein [Caenorhabditis elegans]|uniref:LisH domain-containing protein n=1 Tax=Caenorhabditis elegans TaxID=6239 RepID=Q20453_CAEEL|nr:LisH domain-containing protein [Caenorhabditis elegans]CAA94828.2 LisH domain-containing protein [Caenorhabditis elegans]|eukprot:NP_505524.2 Uncharacterized protein CELE_F46B6.5 [Caenorhabditis elegans]
MQANDQGQKPVGGRGRPQQHQNPQIFENPVTHERIDSLIYGYLRRNGMNQAADAMEQESPFLGESLSRFDHNNRPIVVLNDRLHDHTLEDIITIFNRDGRFGVNKSMVEFGEDLRRLTNRFITITSTPASSGRSTSHQQLYGRSAYSRHKQSQQYSTIRAPQAIAHMELQRVNQNADARYREEQQFLPRVNVLSVAPAPTSSVPVIHQQLHQASPAIQKDNVPDEPVNSQGSQITSGDLQHQFEEDSQKTSRRKINNPQNLNAKVENALNPLVGYINEHEGIADIDFNTEFSLEGINAEFIRALDYDPEREMMQDQQDDQPFNEFFGEVLENREPHLTNASIIVQEEVVVETEEGLVEDGEIEASNRIVYSGVPEPLLSPIPKDLSFRMQPGTTPGRVGQPVQPMKPDNAIPKKAAPVPFEPKLEDRERIIRRSGGRSQSRSLRYGSSPQQSRPVEEQKRHRDTEKERERDHEKRTDRDRDREKRKDKHESDVTSHPTITRHRRYSEAHHSTNVQSDRESISSTSSRSNAPEKRERDAEKERKRKDKEHRRALEADNNKYHAREKEKQKQPSFHQKSNEQQTSEIPVIIRTTQVGGSDKPKDPRKQPIGSPSSAKRKHDDVARREFKIPKKHSSSSKPDSRYGSSSHPKESSAMQSKPYKSSYTKSQADQELCDGDDRKDSTHFLNPVGHLARLSSLLVNCDTTYQQFHDDLQEKISKSRRSANLPSLSPANSEEYSHNNIPVNNHPKGQSFAPRKGALLSAKPKLSPTSSSHSTDPESSSCASSDNETSDATSQRSVARSPDAKKTRLSSLDLSKAEKMLDRIHGPK